MYITGYRNRELPAVAREEKARAGLAICLPGAQALLIHQLFNELLNGIGIERFKTQVGMSEDDLRRIFAEFHAWVEAQPYDADGVIRIRDEQGQGLSSFERVYTDDEIRSLRNLAEIVMLELGNEEFFTRTGFSLVEAKELVDGWNTAMLDPLHLGQQDLRAAS